MKLALIVIGCVLILGGFRGAQSHGPWLATMGGYRYNPSITFQRIGPEVTVYIGYATAGLCILAVIAGLRWSAPGTTPGTSRSGCPTLPVRHFAVRWNHVGASDPIEIFMEVDANGREIRKVERFRDGRLGCADEQSERGTTRLSHEPIPPLSEISADVQFLPRVIRRTEFEEIWNRATQD